jgi:hypothetical protein
MTIIRDAPDIQPDNPPFFIPDFSAGYPVSLDTEYPGIVKLIVLFKFLLK